MLRNSFNTKAALALTVLLGGSVTSFAYPIVGDAGDLHTSAFVLSGFSLSADPIIEDSTILPHSSATGHNNYANDVDWFKFTTLGGSTILDIDTDGLGGLFDTTMALWNSSGALLGQSDDDGGDPGSTTDGVYYYNSRIYATLAPGTYYVAVSDYSNFADGTSAFGVYSGGGGYATGGAYNLHVSTAGTGVPDAGSSVAMLGMAMLGIAGLRRKLNLV